MILTWLWPGGKRLVIKLEDYIRIQDSPIDTDNTNSEDFIEIGKVPDNGEKVWLIKS